jgi:hypothetical protein
MRPGDRFADWLVGSMISFTLLIVLLVMVFLAQANDSLPKWDTSRCQPKC